MRRYLLYIGVLFHSMLHKESICHRQLGNLHSIGAGTCTAVDRVITGA